MKQRKQLEGIITAMVTPFDNDEKLNIAAAKKMARWLVNKGVHGLFIAGTNGEFHLMSADEIVALTKAVVEEVKGEVVVCAGAGRCSTLETIALSKRLKEAGADYISLVTPYYLTPNQEDLYEHYKAITSAIDAPFLLYNIPGQTGLKIETETADKLADLDNIVGIKDSGGDFEQQKAYIKIGEKKDFIVLNGSDSLMLDAFKQGSVASVAATSNVIPEIEVHLYEFFKQGNFEKAQEERNKMDLLRGVLKRCTAPAVMKKTLNEMGVYAGITRKPVQSPKAVVVSEIQTMIKEYNIKEN